MLDKKLGKLKMPSKRPEMDLSDLDSEMPEGSPEEEASESPDEEALEGEATADGEEKGMPGMDKLKAVSDDELLAEIKKRGLMSQLDKGAEGADDSQDMYS